MYSSPSLQRLKERARAAGRIPFGPQTTQERMLYWIVLALPIAWLFGFSELLWPLLTLPLLLSLFLMRRWRMPRFFLVWFLFVGLAMASMYEQLTGLSGMWQLASGYLSATVMLMYVFNADPEEVSDRALVEIMALFWLLIAISGLLGVVTGEAALPSAAEFVLPEELTTEDWVQDLITPQLSHSPFESGDLGLGSNAPQPEDMGWLDYRPTGLLPWSNYWGSAYAAAIPAVLFLLYRPLRTSQRRWIVAILLASLLPFVLSRNRWIWTTVPLIALYAIGRFWRPNRRIALYLAGALLVGVGVIALSPLGAVLGERVAEESGRAYRGDLYTYGLERIAESPILGFGETVEVDIGPSQTITLGKDSQIVHTMILHGLPALGLFVGFLIYGLVLTRRIETPLEATAHFMVLALILHSVFYVIVPTYRLHMMMLAIAGAARYRYVTAGTFRYRPITIYQSTSELGRTVRLNRR